MKKETPIISFIEYENAANNEVATVLFTRYNGSQTVVGRIEERQESDGIMYYAYDSFSRQPYPPARDIDTLKKAYEHDEWNIRAVVNQLDSAMNLGASNERMRQEQLHDIRSSKTVNDSRTK